MHAINEFHKLGCDNSFWSSNLLLWCFFFAARKKEKIKAVKKDKKRYDQLQEESEECQQQLSSCEQRDVLARQVCENSILMAISWVH